MDRKALYVAFLAALSGACAGCVSAPPELKPVGKATVRINPSIKPTRATAQLANEVVIILPPAHPPGYVWQITQHNAATLRQLTEIQTLPDTNESTISFMAMRSGLTRLLFALVPATSGAAVAPADVQEIQLTIE